LGREEIVMSQEFFPMLGTIATLAVVAYFVGNVFGRGRPRKSRADVVLHFLIMATVFVAITTPVEGDRNWVLALVGAVITAAANALGHHRSTG